MNEEADVYSEDRKHRIYWHGHFLRGYKTKEECMVALAWFETFLISLKYVKGE